MARTIAHQFADEIILRLGGGINGIAETKIYFVSSRTGTKEIWVMDYDGQNQHQITHLGTHFALAAHLAGQHADCLLFAWQATDGPSGCTRWTLDGWSASRQAPQVAATFSRPGRATEPRSPSPRRAPEIRRSGLPTRAEEICARLTSFRGPDVAPTWNPRTNAQIAWVSGRTGEPQIYTMDQDGANIQRMTDGGYAISPSWSPNGQLLTFSWNRKYGPGEPGGQDIYVMDIASKRWLQTDPRIGQQRLSLLGAGRPPHRLRARYRRPHRNLVDAGRRHRAASAHSDGEQLHAQLELEVSHRMPRKALTARLGGVKRAGRLHYHVD